MSMSPVGEPEETSAPPAAADVETGLTGGDDEPPPRPAVGRASRPSLRNVLARSLPARRESVHDTLALSSLKRSITDTARTSQNTSSHSVSNGESDDGVDVHSRMLAMAIENASNSAFGIIGVDVWIHDEVSVLDYASCDVSREDLNS